MSRRDCLAEAAAHTVRRYGLLEPDDRVLVGLSGGADSVALTHWLKYGLGVEVAACHLNHNLRGEESRRDELFVRELCARWGIPLFVRNEAVADYARNRRLGEEEAGRELRYAFFEETRSKLSEQTGVDWKIATAHTRTDNAETLLLNVTRGCGMAGLRGIPARRGQIVRPLIDCSRGMVEDYCREQGLAFVTDSTNLVDDYSRNFIRHQVIPALEELNSNAELALQRVSKIAEEQCSYLEEQAGNALPAVLSPEGLCAVELLRLAPAVRHVLLGQWLQKQNIPVTFERMEAVDSLLEAGGGRCCVGENRYLSVSRGILACGPPPEPAAYFEQALEPGVPFTLFGQNYRTEICEKSLKSGKDSPEKVYRNLLYLALDYDKIKGKMLVRQRRPGDRIRLAGRSGSRSLKRLLIDEKLTPAEKAQTLVFSDEEGVCGLWGFGPDQRCAVGEDTKRLLLIRAGDETAGPANNRQEEGN